LFVGSLLGALAVLVSLAKAPVEGPLGAAMSIGYGKATGFFGAIVGDAPPPIPQLTAVPFVAAALAQGSFLWDATYTLIARIVRREDWLHPHKRHLFQRLATAGWSHSRVRRLYAALGITGSAAALAVAHGSRWIAALALTSSVAVFAAVTWLTERTERNASRP
jgi:UDP-N-acetylmuramyl pentapeptide phosphotransferase/UDP-N-acetylglucosamine-1-phosphate transferase